MQALQALEAMEQLGNAPHRRRKVYQKRYDPFSLPDVEFKKRYRFNKHTASFIIDLVRQDLQLDPRGCGTSPELQVLTAIRCWGRREVVCDAKLYIRDIVARWRGSTHDSRIFNESTLKERFERKEFRGRLLGDSGYRLEPYLFTPILRPQNEREEKYNRAQIATRNCVERCFVVWKQRFQSLLYGMTVHMKNVKPTIVALAVLHNIAIGQQDSVPDHDELNTIVDAELLPQIGEARGRDSNNALLRAFIDRHLAN
ncbi:unnamed protein product [Parnassius apollo]|uniref:(apollo) hypothetical protein n=1 Tax=Parnassius apollo TaxID=110799 RepID=A0A8S3W2U4_PARAO|nr:unnamed protein product [Parnassius apollo]